MICGTPVGEEGFGQSVICSKCKIKYSENEKAATKGKNAAGKKKASPKDNANELAGNTTKGKHAAGKKKASPEDNDGTWIKPTTAPNELPVSNTTYRCSRWVR